METVQMQVGDELRFKVNIKEGTGFQGFGTRILYPDSIVSPVDLRDDQDGVQLKINFGTLFNQPMHNAVVVKDAGGNDLPKIDLFLVSLEAGFESTETGLVAEVFFKCNAPGKAQFMIDEGNTFVKLPGEGNFVPFSVLNQTELDVTEQQAGPTAVLEIVVSE
jgi:hypothetical protein